eukprot:574108-Amphidinium_carterae.1
MFGTITFCKVSDQCCDNTEAPHHRLFLQQALFLFQARCLPNNHIMMTNWKHPNRRAQDALIGCRNQFNAAR